MREKIINDGTVSIPNYCYRGHAEIKCVCFPESVREVGVGAFSGCTNLEKVRLNEGMTRLRKELFSGCTGLKEVHLPDTLESIGEWAFRDCAGLERLVIPKSVKEICAESFLGCSNLTIIAEKGSYVGEYAEKHGFNRQILG